MKRFINNRTLLEVPKKAQHRPKKNNDSYWQYIQMVQRFNSLGNMFTH